MKRILLAFGVALALGGCAEGYGGYSYYGGGPAYYDDFYGPYAGGYWGHDGFYYYRNGSGRGPYVRDDAHHFRRDQVQGFHGVQSHGGFHRAAPSARGGPGPHP